MEKIVLIGAGGHAKTIVDTIERTNCYEIAGFLDGGEIGREIYRGYRVIGHDEDADSIYDGGVRNAVIAVGALGRSDLRNRLFQEMKRTGFYFPVIIDPTAIVAEDTVIGEGTYIGRNAVINVDVRIGRNCIINTAAIIEHECVVGDFAHISVGAILCGSVKAHKGSFIGAGSTVIQGISIGEDSVVGANSTVIGNVGNKQIVHGIVKESGGVGFTV